MILSFRRWFDLLQRLRESHGQTVAASKRATRWHMRYLHSEAERKRLVRNRRMLISRLRAARWDARHTARYRLAWESARQRAENRAGSERLARSRWVEIQRLNDQIARLNVEINAHRLAATNRQVGMGDLVPAVTTEALGSKDRANVLRLTDENERLRAVAEHCEKEHR